MALRYYFWFRVAAKAKLVRKIWRKSLQDQKKMELKDWFRVNISDDSKACDVFSEILDLTIENIEPKMTPGLYASYRCCSSLSRRTLGGGRRTGCVSGFGKW